MSIIALDIDSVLADIIPIWCIEYNRRKEKDILSGKTFPVQKADIVGWNFHHYLPIEEMEVYDIFHVVWTKYWEDIPPTEENLGEVVNNIIKKGHRVSILSARKRFSIPMVAQWVIKHNIPYNDLIFIEDMRPKSDFPFDILLDDGIHNVKELDGKEIIVGTGINDIPITKQNPKGVLMTQPWNINEDHPYKASSVSEFVRLYL